MPRPNRGAALKWVGKRGAWYIVWYEAGRERSRSTGTRISGEAQAALAEFIRAQQRAQRTGEPKRADELKVAEVLDLYADQHAPTAAAPERIGYAIEALLPFWGERRVSEITKQSCRDYVAQRERAPGTVRRELGTLTAALNFAVQERMLASAPFVELPETPPGKDRWLTRSEAARLLNAARTARGDVRLYLPLFIVLGLYTGARKEAISSLTWAQIDLDKRQINFARVGERITDKGRARQRITARVMTFLKLAYRRRAIRPDDIDNEKLSEADKLARGFVVHDAGRQILDIGDSKSGSFGSACRRAKLTDVSPHTLRHTCGTWLAQAGVPLWKVGGWLGHSSEATTRLYAHHSPEHQEDVQAALDRRR